MTTKLSRMLSSSKVPKYSRKTWQHQEGCCEPHARTWGAVRRPRTFTSWYKNTRIRQTFEFLLVRANKNTLLCWQRGRTQCTHQFWLGTFCLRRHTP